MANEAVGEDAAAVLATVRAFFETTRGRRLEQLHGPLREWSGELRQLFPADAFVYEPKVDEIELVELGASSAVARVRAREVVGSKVGGMPANFVYDGLVLLEKVDGSWLIVDHHIGGRSRLGSIVRGRLAAQEQRGVTIRVLGVERTTSATIVLADVENGSAADATPARAFVRARPWWSRAWVGPLEPIQPGSTRRVMLIVGRRVSLTRGEVPVALELATAHDQLPFLLRVPLDGRDGTAVQPAPRRLPLGVRATRLYLVAFAAALTAALIPWFGWFALIVPLLLAVVYYRAYRAADALPRWVARLRVPLALAWAAAFGFVIWHSTLLEFLLPGAVAALAFVVVRRIGVVGRRGAALLGVAAGAAFFFAVGSGAKPLSACRLFDDPEATADAFAHALLAGDYREAQRHVAHDVPDIFGLIAAQAPKSFSRAEAEAAVRTGAEPTLANGCATLSEGKAPRCYTYAVTTGTEAVYHLTTSLTCELGRWRVNSWS